MQEQNLLQQNSKKEKKQQKMYSISIYLLSLCFLLLFSSYNSAQNMISQIYDQQGFKLLGNISLFTIYTVFTLNCLLSPCLIQKISYKKSICISIWGYILFFGSGVLGCSCEKNKELFFCKDYIIILVNVICSMICGFCAAIIWVAASSYISEACETKEQKAYYFGIFGACALGSQFFGNLSTVLVLKYFDHMIYFAIFFCISSCSAFLLTFIQNIEQKQVKDLENVENNKDESITFMINKVKQVIKQKFTIRMGFQYFGTGYIIGIYSAFLYRVIEDSLNLNDLTKEQINVKTGLCFIVLGGVEIFMGLIFNQLTKIIDRYNLQIISCFLALLNIIIIFIATRLQIYTLCFLAAATCGIYESLSTNCINLIISQDIQAENQVYNFSAFRLIQSLGVMISILFTIILKQQAEWIYLLISFFVYTLITVVITNYSYKQYQRNKNSL